MKKYFIGLLFLVSACSTIPTPTHYANGTKVRIKAPYIVGECYGVIVEWGGVYQHNPDPNVYGIAGTTPCEFILLNGEHQKVSANWGGGFEKKELEIIK